MDWLWPLYEEHVRRIHSWKGIEVASTQMGEAFMKSLAESTATLYVMEPVGDTIRFRGLGRWPLGGVPELMGDPHAFIADRFGGGKFKVNFHHGPTFVGTHNFRTYGEERWRDLPEVVFE